MKLTRHCEPDIPAAGAAVGPLGIAVHANGDLYLGERSDASSRVRKIAGGIIATVAGGGRSPLDDIPAISAQLAPPVALALDAAGNLYMADMFSHRIRKVSQGRITTVAGNGKRGFSGDNGPATSAELNFPTGIAVDAGGALYIADSANRRVRKVVNGVITTIAGNGEPTFAGDDGPALSASMSPSDLAVDAAGNVYLTDTVNGRVRKLQPQGQAPAGLAAVAAKPLPPAPLRAELQGRVVDPAGQPVRGLAIFAKPVLDAQPELSEFLTSSAPGVLTNDRGEFHMRDLKPGSYRVRAAPPFDPNAKPTTGSAFRLTYYPNASTWAEASTVKLAAAGDPKKIEIQMRQTRHSVVSGRVVYPAGWEPPQGTPEDPNPVVGSVMLVTAMGSGQVRRDGSFRIEGVPPGDHQLLAQVNGSRGTEHEQLTGVSQIPGLVADASGIQMALELNARLQGKVTFAGPPPAEGFWIYLVRGQHGGGHGGGDPATYPRLWIDPKDPKFDFVRTQADDYRLVLGAGHARDRSLSLRMNGTELPFGGPFRLPGGTTQVTLQVTRHAGRVQGSVKDENGGPAVEAAVFLLPESATDLLDAVRIGSSDEAGRYRILGVKPGRYRIGAAPGMSYDEAAKYATQLDFLRVLHSVATPLEVSKPGAITPAPPLRVASR